ncbi:MAG: PIN domain-containing protein [bacterium]
MSGKFFLDTNILVYSFDHSASTKQKKAQKLITDALDTGKGVISSQVVQEFLNVATKTTGFNTPFKPEDLRMYLQEVLLPLCEVFSNDELFSLALDVKQLLGASFYDALIVAGALQGQCETLYTEDLQDGRAVLGVTIRNPFG